MPVFEVKSNECFVCGSNKGITSHHGIPQTLKPKNNVVIPVCLNCHERINQVDFGAVSSYLYKILKVTEEKTAAIRGLQRIVEHYQKPTEKKDNALQRSG